MSKRKFDWEGLICFTVIVLLFGSCELERHRKYELEKNQLEVLESNK